jgi:hypothetical protein
MFACHASAVGQDRVHGQVGLVGVIQLFDAGNSRDQIATRCI